MKNVRVPMIVLAALHLAFACFVALTASFADGGTITERILLSLVHPVAAILLLVVVVSSKPVTSWLRRITLALLSVNIAGDIVVGALIGQGVLRGDWFLPLLFAVVPLIGLAYISASPARTA